MNKAVILVLCVCIMFACSCNTIKQQQQVLSNKIAPGKLQSDFALLYKVLQKNHPSLYWYTTKDSLDNYYNSIYNTLTDSLTEVQFKKSVSYFISKIHCGHTAVRSSKLYTKAIQKNRPPAFPLSIKVLEDSLVVTNNALRNDSFIQRGTVITAINGVDSRHLLDSMFQFISTDGYSDNFKSQLISFNFPAFYRNAFDTAKQYTVSYLDAADKQHTITLPAYNAKADTARKNYKPDGIKKTTAKQRRQLRKLSERSLQIDTPLSTAYMRLTTFSGSHLLGFFRKSFKQLHQQNIQNLVVDLRENGGGKMGISTEFARYLSNHKFKNADTVAALTTRLPYGRYIQPAFIYRISMFLMSRRQNDQRYHFRHYEKHYFAPKTKDHFNGNIYMLQSGFTFSASCMLLHTLKGQKNVTLVGEETGGGNYGNTSVLLPNLQLPNSKLRIVLPLYRIVFNANAVKDGRGIMPDVLVNHTTVTIKEGVDAKLDATMQMIKNKMDDK